MKNRKLFSNCLSLYPTDFTDNSFIKSYDRKSGRSKCMKTTSGAGDFSCAKKTDNAFRSTGNIITAFNQSFLDKCYPITGFASAQKRNILSITELMTSTD